MSYLEVVGHREALALQETLCTDVVIAAHAVCVRTAMQSQYTGEFPTFPNTREHTASYFQNVVDWIAPTRPQNYEIIMRF